MYPSDLKVIVEKLKDSEKVKRDNAFNTLNEWSNGEDFEIQYIIPYLQEKNLLVVSSIIRIIAKKQHSKYFNLLENLYLQRNEIFVLIYLIEKFILLENGCFENAVLQKIDENSKFYDKKNLDNILFLSIKYLQNFGTSIAKDVVKKYLSYDNDHIRYHALLYFNKKGLILEKKIVHHLMNDKYRGVKELAKLYAEIFHLL